MLILNDSSKEANMDVLQNVKNNMLDNFGSIKWLFHGINDISYRTMTLEGKINNQKDTIADKESLGMGSLIDMVFFYLLEDKVLELETR